MVKTTVMKVHICCKKCKQKLMLAVSRLLRIDVIEIDEASSTLTVTGNADPLDVIARARKATPRCVVVVSVGPPPEVHQEPQEQQKKPEEEEEKKKAQEQQQEAPPVALIQVPAMYHVCHQVVAPEPDCSIM